VLNVCVPPDLPPYIESSVGEGVGSEAVLVRRVAARIGVDVAWSLQSGWLTSPDPVDWGLRPESCDLLAGGIVDSEDTRALMTLSDYQKTGWTLLSLGQRAGRLAILNPHWGLASDRAFDWADRRGQDYDLLTRSAEALDGVRAGKYAAVLALAPENRWLQTQQALPAAALQPVPALGPVRLALGVWKTRITLRRAVAAVLDGR
jgi:polar amino acid transport system substrate-binding protein